MLKVVAMVVLNIAVTLAFASAQTVYYNNMRSGPPVSVFYNDRHGNFIGDSYQSGNSIFYNDRNGNLVGTGDIQASPDVRGDANE